jgi:hypothetical protein
MTTYLLFSSAYLLDNITDACQNFVENEHLRMN